MLSVLDLAPLLAATGAVPTLGELRYQPFKVDDAGGPEQIRADGAGLERQGWRHRVGVGWKSRDEQATSNWAMRHASLLHALTAAGLFTGLFLGSSLASDASAATAGHALAVSVDDFTYIDTSNEPIDHGRA
jgi:hypothetical protein